ncbi:MAG: sulfatase-like hydrolase/transferase [Verrucomicrobiales bacterium]
MNAIAFRSLAAAFCLAAISFDDAAAAPAPGDGWIDLFDGKTTAGWTPRSEVVSFEAKGGELHLLSKANCWVTTAVEMADFIAEAEVLLPDDAAESGFNSGLAFRCTGAKGKPKGYQCEIDLDKPGGIYGIGLGGWLYPNKATNAEYAARAKGALKRGAWNQFRVVAEGPRLRTYLNGALIADIEDARAARGYFGIQHHGKGGVVKFRKIRARAIAPAQAEAGAGQRPNILWITAEDMSPTLGCYGDAYAITPHLDAFARQSVRYDNAFAAAPVCSPSRSCLITGMYPASLGTHQMRSEFPLPSGVRGFPAYLREAGYFTANNVKTDYNCADAARLVAESWDVSSAQAHWRKAARGPDQPFFAVFNDMVSHQSRTMTWPYAAFREHVQRGLKPGEIHDPAAAPVPPYYPDTPAVRRTIARYYDCVTAMDQNVGSLLAELEEDGLAEDPIVFFYSDHGSGMPRHKRLPHDSGMRVALLVRFPEKWRHLAPAAPGGATDQLVSFADFAPTVLRLAGVEPPPSMQGKPFLGGGEARRFAYGSRDRVDEAFEFSRSVRDGRWLYIRNYLPHLSWNQPTVFSDLSEIRPAITEFAAAHPADLTAAQRGYAGASKPPEEFYDCAADPHNVENLAGQNLGAEQRAALDRLRAEFAERRLAIRDSQSRSRRARCARGSRRKARRWATSWRARRTIARTSPPSGRRRIGSAPRRPRSACPISPATSRRSGFGRSSRCATPPSPIPPSTIRSRRIWRTPRQTCGSRRPPGSRTSRPIASARSPRWPPISGTATGRSRCGRAARPNCSGRRRGRRCPPCASSTTAPATARAMRISFSPSPPARFWQSSASRPNRGISPRRARHRRLLLSRRQSSGRIGA